MLLRRGDADRGGFWSPRCFLVAINITACSPLVPFREQTYFPLACRARRARRRRGCSPDLFFSRRLMTFRRRIRLRAASRPDEQNRQVQVHRVVARVVGSAPRSRVGVHGRDGVFSPSQLAACQNVGDWMTFDRVEPTLLERGFFCRAEGQSGVVRFGRARRLFSWALLQRHVCAFISTFLLRYVAPVYRRVVARKIISSFRS